MSVGSSRSAQSFGVDERQRREAKYQREMRYLRRKEKGKQRDNKTDNVSQSTIAECEPQMVELLGQRSRQR